MPIPNLCYKNYEAKTADVDKDKNTEVSIISTSTVDRDREVVVSKGLKFPDHITVLFNHEPDKPVGRKVWTATRAGVVKAKTEYGPTPYAQEIFALVMSGILLQKSIGMDPATMKRRQLVSDDIRKNIAWQGAKTIIDEAEVLEYSVIAIAANLEAVREAKCKGLIRLSADAFPCLEVEPRIVRVSMAKVRRVPPPQPRVKRHRMGRAELTAMVKEQWNVYNGIL